MTFTAPDDGLPVRIDALYLHPIRGCAPVAVDTLDLDESGRVPLDRAWMVVGTDGAAEWLGGVHALAHVRSTLDRASGVLVIEAPGAERVVLPLAPSTPDRTFRLWSDFKGAEESFPATDAGDAAAALLRAATGRDLRLVRAAPEALVRDGLNTLHVVSRASLADVDAIVGTPLDARRFRANVVLAPDDDDPDALMPFLEETSSTLAWDGGALAFSDPCIRCIVPSVDPSTGTPDEHVAAALAKASAARWPGAPVRFGMYARAAAGTRSLSVGTRAWLVPDF